MMNSTLTQDPISQKIIKFNPGLSQILSKFFLPKDMQLEPLLQDKVMITQNVVECLNDINVPKCSKVLNVITSSPKCNNFLP